MSEQAQGWPGFKYEPIPALVDRLIARQLRTARKNMTRLFQERGMFDLADRVRRIRKSNAGMMEKNRRFQEVLNDYAERVNPRPAPAVAASEAASLEDTGHHSLGVSGREQPGAHGGEQPSRSDGIRLDAAGSVRGVEVADAGPVIEE